MNENIDLTKILKNCPKGWKLYTPILGEVEFDSIEEDSDYPIILSLQKGGSAVFSKEGFFFIESLDAECLLFPSKEQRDWSKFRAPWYKKEKFDPKTLNQFDKVLVRDTHCNNWTCGFFSHIIIFNNIHRYNVGGIFYKYCIPYNDDTKHLVGKMEEAPEYYRYL